MSSSESIWASRRQSAAPAAGCPAAARQVFSGALLGVIDDSGHLLARAAETPLKLLDDRA
jgi:hypothetical protein